MIHQHSTKLLDLIARMINAIPPGNVTHIVKGFWAKKSYSLRIWHDNRILNRGYIGWNYFRPTFSMTFRLARAYMEREPCRPRKLASVRAHLQFAKQIWNQCEARVYIRGWQSHVQDSPRLGTFPSFRRLKQRGLSRPAVCIIELLKIDENLFITVTTVLSVHAT
jgi:hypothetical protein